MSVTGLGTKRRRRALPVVQMVSVLMLLAAIALFVLQLVQFSRTQELLSADVTVAGISVGNMQPQEAVSRWEQSYSQPVVLYYAGSPILLDPAAVGFRTSRETMLAAARAAGDVERDAVAAWLGHRPYPAGFSSWPPNSLRMAERILSAKSASPRELKRS
jgi:hypothetical protein